MARHEASDDSDIDVVVVMPPDLHAMVHLKEKPEEALNTPVDLVRYRAGMNTAASEKHHFPGD